MKKVLIIEDEKGAQYTFKAYFWHLGYEVSEANSAEEALQRLTEESFDLIILDLILPGISGAEFLLEYKKTQKAPVICVTAMSPEHCRYVHLYNYPCLYKPFDVDIFEKMVLSA
jgi:CheY-like chemotaxis protein